MTSSARQQRERLRNSNLTPLSQLSLRGVLLEPLPASPLISTRNLVPGLSSSVVKLDRLGKGATSNVFRAVHAATLKMVALKEVSVSTAADRKAVRTEMRALVTQRSPLLHSTFTTELAACPRIVEYYGSVVRENGNACIAVEYVAGGSLGSWLDSKCRCPEAWIAHIAHQALEALDFLHRGGRVHRDVKPANLLITRRGDLKLADFGAAGVEHSSRMVGTQRFMAPERLKGRPATAQSDLWSLGLTLATAALGENPICKASSEFEQTELADRAEKTIRKEKSLSPGLADFLCKCLARDRTRRPALSELMQHEFLEQRIGWEKNCPEVAMAMRDRKRQQREDASALSTEAVLDALCQARAEDNIMGARSRVDTTTAADLAYELGVTPQSLVNRVRQRTQQLIRRANGCPCGGHRGDRPGGGGLGLGAGVTLTGSSCFEASCGSSGPAGSRGSRLICMGDGLDMSPGSSSTLCGLSPMASPPFLSMPCSARDSREQDISQHATKSMEAAAMGTTAAPVATVRSTPRSNPAVRVEAPETVTKVDMPAAAGAAAQTPLSPAGTPAPDGTYSVALAAASALPEVARTPKLKPMELSSNVRLTPDKRRDERVRRSSRKRGNGTPGRDSRDRRSRAHRHHRARGRGDGGVCGDGDGDPNRSGAVTVSRGRDHGAVGRRSSSRREEEGPRTAVSRMLRSRSKVRSTRLVFTVADRMKEELKVTDRIHCLQVYKNCFSGREAVQWMLETGYASSINEATQLGNEMMNSGVFEHISNSHLFEDSSVLYRFSDGQELPPPASGGRRFGQIARVVMKKFVDAVVGGKGNDEFEQEISGMVRKASSLSENVANGRRSGVGSRPSSRRSNSAPPPRSSPNKHIAAVKQAAYSDFSTSAPSAMSGGPSPTKETADIGVAVVDKPTSEVTVLPSSSNPGNPPLGRAKPPRVPNVDRKGLRRRGDQDASGVRSAALRRFNSSVSATTMPETPTPS